MELISEVRISKNKSLQLLKGDLTEIPKNHEVDFIVISAFPDDYFPSGTSLVGAFNRKGLSVESLSNDKELDIRRYSDCWISKEICFPNINRILCFEPHDRGNPYSLIAGIFQSLMLISKQFPIKSIAMPLLLSGDQGYANDMVINELVRTSILWLKNEPFQVIKIVERNLHKLMLLKSAFEKELEMVESKDSLSYDFFISYSRKNSDEIAIIKEKLGDRFNLFIDTEEVELGANWLDKVNKSLPISKRFIVCVSDTYVTSKICKYEYSFCNLKFINDGGDCVLPIYLHTAELPFEMSIVNYYDAREGNKHKINKFCEKIIKSYS